MKKLLLLVAVLGLPMAAHATSTISPANSFSYGANIGWMNWRPSSADGVEIGEYVCSGYIYGANVGPDALAVIRGGGCQFSPGLIDAPGDVVRKTEVLLRFGVGWIGRREWFFDLERARGGQGPAIVSERAAIERGILPKVISALDAGLVVLACGYHPPNAANRSFVPFLADFTSFGFAFSRSAETFFLPVQILL